jgi:hypothetical protein
MTRNMKLAALIASGSILAAGSGALGATALTGSSQQVPTKTVTIELANGTTGPQGPAGPAGPPGPKGDTGAGGAESCPTGSTFGELKFIIQGQGPTSIFTCIVD